MEDFANKGTCRHLRGGPKCGGEPKVTDSNSNAAGGARGGEGSRASVRAACPYERTRGPEEGPGVERGLE